MLIFKIFKQLVNYSILYQKCARLENIKDHALKGIIPMWDWNDEKELVWLDIAPEQFVYNKNEGEFYYRVHRGEESSKIEHSTAMSILKHQKALNDLCKEAFKS